MDALTGNVITGIEELTQQSIAETFVLYQNYPNPFNPVTQIDFQLPNTSGVKLEVYDIAGRRVKILLKKRLMAGHHAVKWDGTNMARQPAASGVYLYRHTVKQASPAMKRQSGLSYTPTHKMVLLK